MTKFTALLGKTITAIRGMEKDSEEIIFETDEPNRYRMYHEQECCESVVVEDVCGSVEDLIGSPITIASEETNSDVSAYHESQTWTFYKLATVKGYVTIRWLGTSNGYYSESVYFEGV